MADRRLLPTSVTDERSEAVLELIERLAEIDLVPLLVYRIDSVPAAALYVCAWQFGVTGLGGWELANTEAQRRELVRRAIEFHRHKGTGWVIREVLAAVGFPVTVDEFWGRNLYDGTRLYDGTVTYSVAAVWADFGVIFGDPADAQPITAAKRDLLRGVVEAWKPARCRLVSMRFQSYRYDGQFRYDGEMIYAGAQS